MLYLSLLLFITKKTCDFMFPERMNKFYIAIALYSLNAYANTNMLIRRYYNLIYFYFVKLNDSIIFIKDGNQLELVKYIYRNHLRVVRMLTPQERYLKCMRTF